MPAPTVPPAVELLSAARGQVLRESLPTVLFTRPFGETELWQWLGLALVMVGGWLARVGGVREKQIT